MKVKRLSRCCSPHILLVLYKTRKIRKRDEGSKQPPRREAKRTKHTAIDLVIYNPRSEKQKEKNKSPLKHFLIRVTAFAQLKS